jgi:hypothetical protein
MRRATTDAVANGYFFKENNEFQDFGILSHLER